MKYIGIVLAVWLAWLPFAMWAMFSISESISLSGGKRSATFQRTLKQPSLNMLLSMHPPSSNRFVSRCSSIIFTGRLRA